MSNIPDIRDIVIKLQLHREMNGNYSYTFILNRMKEKGIPLVAKSTLSRIYSKSPEEVASSLNYEVSIRPVAMTMLDLETIEESGGLDIDSLKDLLKRKLKRISELEQQIEHLKIAHDKELLEKMEAFDKEREAWAQNIEMLKGQIALKDKRMDQQNERTNDYWFTLKEKDADLKAKDAEIKQLTKDLMDVKSMILSCPCRKAAEKEE